MICSTLKQSMVLTGEEGGDGVVGRRRMWTVMLYMLFISVKFVKLASSL